MKLKDALKGIEVINDEAHEMFPPQDVIETPGLRAIACDIHALDTIYDMHKKSGYSARKKLDYIKKVLDNMKKNCARETGISGNFVGRIKGAKCPFDLQFLTWDFS